MTLMVTHPSGMQAAINALNGRVMEIRRPKNQCAEPAVGQQLQDAVNVLGQANEAAHLKWLMTDAKEDMHSLRWCHALAAHLLSQHALDATPADPDHGHGQPEEHGATSGPKRAIANERTSTKHLGSRP